MGSGNCGWEMDKGGRKGGGEMYVLVDNGMRLEEKKKHKEDILKREGFENGRTRKDK